MKRILAHFIFGLFGQAAFASGPEMAMTADEVSRVIAQAISRAKQIEPHAIIAVVDREGFVLGVLSVDGKVSPPPASKAAVRLTIKTLDAITKAGTAAFLSSDKNAFTSRTAGFIVQQHFPPKVANRPNGPLVGVNFSNLCFSDVNRFKNPNVGHVADGTSGTNGAPIVKKELVPLLGALSGLAGSPGGVPLYRGEKLIGAVGVAGRSDADTDNPISIVSDIQDQPQDYDPDEDVALAGQSGFEPAAEILGSNVFIDGIRVPYVKSSTVLGTGGSVDSSDKRLIYPIVESPRVSYPIKMLGGQNCEIRTTIIDDSESNPINGVPRLTSKEVEKILSQASDRARITRAGIRLPAGQPAETFITVVNAPALPNKKPVVLGTIRTPGATMFSWDVAIQKARTALFFSNDHRAFSSRTVGFMAEEFYPPGIAKTAPGPFYGLQEQYSLLPNKVPNFLSSTPKMLDVINPLNKVQLTDQQVRSKPNPYLPNGITIFPGGFPLYRNGVMIGAIGVSGDGIDQDDIIAIAGTVGFEAPEAIRADRMKYQGARLPYAKFPRNPDL